MLFALRSLDRRIKLALSALFGLTLVSITVLTLGYREADGTRMSVLDALYFTVETIGTVGFGDFYFRDQHTWLRIWAIVLMVTGATLATVFFALLTNVLISRTIAASLGRRRVTGLSGHVMSRASGRSGSLLSRSPEARHRRRGGGDRRPEPLPGPAAGAARPGRDRRRHDLRDLVGRGPGPGARSRDPDE